MERVTTARVSALKGFLESPVSGKRVPMGVGTVVAILESVSVTWAGKVPCAHWLRARWEAT